jgi:hypothetical protein
MAGTPLRISDELMLRARREAEDSDRSVTGQIEHWAKLGMALEAVLGHPQATELKRSARLGMADALAFAGSARGRAAAHTHLRAAGQPRYGADPEVEGQLIRISPDGSRTRGRMVNRTFVPNPGE